MKNSIRTSLRLALLLPAFLLISCGDDPETPVTPTPPVVNKPAKVCRQLSDSSASGIATLTYDAQDRLTGFNFDNVNTTFTYQGDSIFYNLNSDTLQYKEVLFKQDSIWKKSIQRVTLDAANLGGTVESEITFTPTYTSGKVTSIAKTTVTKIIIGGFPIPALPINGSIVLTRNSDGNITRFSVNENGQTQNYNYTYSPDNIGKTNVGIYAISLSEILQGGIIPLFLGYVNPFTKMPLTFTSPVGSKTYSNWRTDSTGNLTNYNVVGTGNYEEETGAVKSTFSCK